MDIVEATKRYSEGTMIKGYFIDSPVALNWRIKAKNVISMACGETSEHYRMITALENSRFPHETNYQVFLKFKAVFDAAREDYDGGFCNTMRSLVQAEVFSDELEQARELLNAGYHPAAAVIIGAVLETTLRELCGKHQIPTGKLDKMNADLAKAGQYNSLVQKQVTAWAAIRNSAAHGKNHEFTIDDVRNMLPAVEAFLAVQI